jgi:hypothetical protein
MSARFEDLIELAGLNVASGLFMLATFRWDVLIPPPERLVEWAVGLTVGLTIIILNIAKLVKLYVDTRRK